MTLQKQLTGIGIASQNATANSTVKNLFSFNSIDIRAFLNVAYPSAVKPHANAFGCQRPIALRLC